MKRGLESLSLSAKSVVPIRHKRLLNSNAPIIENIVSTFDMLPQVFDKRYRLPLDSIASALRCSQYAPVSFAACIIKLSDSITDSTALIFATGKIVIVASLSRDHALYVSQLVRFIVEQVQAVFLGPPQRVDCLVGYTIFENCSIHNIVGKGDLNRKLDLQAMAEAAPLCCKYHPKDFPGLQCKVQDPPCGMRILLLTNTYTKGLANRDTPMYM